jgi:hypothetical protein
MRVPLLGPGASPTRPNTDKNLLGGEHRRDELPHGCRSVLSRQSKGGGNEAVDPLHIYQYGCRVVLLGHRRAAAQRRETAASGVAGVKTFLQEAFQAGAIAPAFAFLLPALPVRRRMGGRLNGRSWCLRGGRESTSLQSLWRWLCFYPSSFWYSSSFIRGHSVFRGAAAPAFPFFVLAVAFQAYAG